MIDKRRKTMDWVSIAVLVLLVVGLILFNALTGAGSRLNCQSSWREALKKSRFKDDEKKDEH